MTNFGNSQLEANKHESVNKVVGTREKLVGQSSRLVGQFSRLMYRKLYPRIRSIEALQ